MPDTDELAAAMGIDRGESPATSLRIAPRRFTVCEGVGDRIEAFLREQSGISSVTVIGGERGYAAVRAELDAAFERVGVEAVYRSFEGECTVSAVRRHRGATDGPDLVVGVGGGKALDTAKLVAEGRCPVVTVPTSAATSAGWAALSVVYDDEGCYRGGIPLAGCPDALVLDPSAVADAPARYLANGVMDASAKFFETSLIDRDEVGPLGALGRSVAQDLYARPLRDYATTAVADARDGEVTPALEVVSEAVVAGPGVAAGLLSDRTYLTMPHVFCYTLLPFGSVQSDSFHGERVAYGVLVLQALLDRPAPDLRALKRWYESLGESMTLANLGAGAVSIDRLGRTVYDRLAFNLLPRSVSASDVIAAIETVEATPSATDP